MESGINSLSLGNIMLQDSRNSSVASLMSESAQELMGIRQQENLPSSPNIRARRWSSEGHSPTRAHSGAHEVKSFSKTVVWQPLAFSIILEASRSLAVAAVEAAAAAAAAAAAEFAPSTTGAKSAHDWLGLSAHRHRLWCCCRVDEDYDDDIYSAYYPASTAEILANEAELAPGLDCYRNGRPPVRNCSMPCRSMPNM